MNDRRTPAKKAWANANNINANAQIVTRTPAQHSAHIAFSSLSHAYASLTGPFVERMYSDIGVDQMADYELILACMLSCMDRFQEVIDGSTD